MLDSLSGAQRPAEGELGGRRLLLTSFRLRAISCVSQAFLSARGLIPLHLPPSIPLRILRRLLFLLFLLLLLRVGMRFPLPVLSQLEGDFRGEEERLLLRLRRGQKHHHSANFLLKAQSQLPNVISGVYSIPRFESNNRLRAHNSNQKQSKKQRDTEEVLTYPESAQFGDTQAKHCVSRGKKKVFSAPSKSSLPVTI